MKFKLKEITKGHLTSVPGGKVDAPAEPEAQDQYDPGAWDEETPAGFEANPSLEKIQGDEVGHPMGRIQSRLDNIKKALRFKLIKNEEN